MKKTIFVLCVAIVGISLYSYKISTELRSLKEFKLGERATSSEYITYTKVEPQKLIEPSESKFDDVLERIKMLKQHLSYDPSPEWVESVIDAAEYEILQLSRALGQQQ